LYRIRWREGLSVLVYLYHHPYDTAQIARAIEAFTGRSVPRLLHRLEKRTRGRELLEKRPSLRDALADTKWLEGLAEGSLGRAYLDYCRGEGLTSSMTPYVDQGTNACRNESLPEDEAYIQDYLFHCHDIFHLVAGYHTDLIGEVCLLAFTAPQT